MRRERETSRREPAAQKRIAADHLRARGETLFGARVYFLSCTCKRLARSHEQDVDDDGNDAGSSIHCSISRRTTTRKKRRDYNTRSRVSNM